MPKKVENEETQELGVNSTAMLAKANEKRTIIKYNDRVNLEIIKDTRHYRKGMTIAPHRLFAEELINNGIAKEVKD